MIQPIHKGSQGQRLIYPISGESGFGNSVGRKHLSTKLSAIQKLIFNQDIKPPSRQSYNHYKLEHLPPVKQSFHSSQPHRSLSPSPQQENSYSMKYYPSQQQLRVHQYDLMQRQSSLYQMQDLSHSVLHANERPAKQICPPIRPSRLKRIPERESQLSQNYRLSLLQMRERQKQKQTSFLIDTTVMSPEETQHSRVQQYGPIRISPTFLSSKI